MADMLPPYAERLDALHHALADGFAELVSHVSITGNETVLDAGCGDGFFTNLLANRLPKGRVVALDACEAFLNVLRRRFARSIVERRIRPQHGDVNALDFPDASFDVVWSAHSMQSYPAIAPVLREFRRVLRPDGVVAILETDNLHSLVLSWPPEFEMEVRQAEHRKFGDGDGRIGAYFPRYAEGLLREAGFCNVTRQYRFIHRHRPVGEAAETYARLYLEDLLERVGDMLNAATRALARELASPDSERFLPQQENFYFGSLQMLFMARRAERYALREGTRLNHATRVSD